MKIHFTKHAEEKFKILSNYGVKISKIRVIKTVKKPNIIDNSRNPLFIARSDLDKNHVLRVVYKTENNFLTVITFYPGRKSQYEKK